MTEPELPTDPTAPTDSGPAASDEPASGSPAATQADAASPAAGARDLRLTRGARLRRWLNTWPGQLLVLALLFLGVRAWQLRGAVQGEAPPVAGRSVAAPDATLSLADLRGQPTLVYFWATWCGVCEHVDPNVAAVARDHQVITVAVQSGSGQAVRAWMDERGLSMPTIADPSSRISRAYGVRAFPTSFWIDAEGQIRYREVGYTSQLGFLGRLWWLR